MNINKYLKKLNIDFQIDGDTFIFTLEDKTKKTKAIFVCAYSKVWQKKYYLCIPIANELLKKQYEDFLKTWDKQILTSYSVAFSEILTLSLTEAEKK